jgi:hypothetical protein
MNIHDVFRDEVMLFGGGWKYPSEWILATLSIISLLIVLFLAYIKQADFVESATLFLNLEGTVLIACSFAPVGLSPPSKAGIINEVKHIFSSEKLGTPVSFNPWMFYSGFVFLFLGSIASFMAK